MAEVGDRMARAAAKTQALSMGAAFYEIRLGVTGFVIEGRARKGDSLLAARRVVGYQEVTHGRVDPFPPAIDYVHRMLMDALA